MLKKVSVVVLCAIACTASAQVVRQVSTNSLIKAVYTVNVADCQQFVRNVFDEEIQLYLGDVYYAIVPVPEVTLTNMPTVTVRIPSTTIPSGWVDDDGMSILGEGVVYLLWKRYYVEYEIPWKTYFTKAIITVDYEAQSQPELKVTNTGTGKSLALEWSTNAPNAKVEGYKVYRRSIAE